MEIYILLYFVLLMSSFMTSKRNYFYFFVFIFFVGLAGFRSDDVGVDTDTYRLWFKWINSGENVGFMEPGWVLLNRFVYLIGGNFMALLTFTSFLTLLPVFYVSKKVSPYVFFSVFIFYSLHLYLGAFNIMRQYLGVSLVLIAYYYLSQDKKVLAIVSFCVAVSIHYSCSLAIFVYFWQNHYLTKKRVLLYTIVSFMLGSIINDSIVEFLTFTKYANIAEVRENSFSIAIFTIVFDLLMFYLIGLNEKISLGSFWGKMYILSMLVFNSTYSLSYNARVYSLFAISQIVYFPLLLKNLSSHNRIIPALVVLLYVSAQFWRMLLANANKIVPYQLNLPIF